MFEDKQRQSRSAQGAQRERERGGKEEALLARDASSAATRLDHQCLMVYISTGLHQSGLQGPPRILRNVSEDVSRNAKSKAAGLALLRLLWKTSSRVQSLAILVTTDPKMAPKWFHSTCCNLAQRQSVWDCLWSLVSTLHCSALRQLCNSFLNHPTTKILSDGGLWVNSELLWHLQHEKNWRKNSWACFYFHVMSL